MPDKSFLETYPLYRKYILENIDVIPKPPVHMYCGICKSKQTFTLSDKYEYERQKMRSSLIVSAGHVPGAAQALRKLNEEDFIERVIYKCAACNIGETTYLLKFSPSDKSVQKAGQYPPWSINVEKSISDTLGDNVDIYKKGLICESQGYGIGAFAYYRRIVELVIDDLLEKISDIMTEEEQTAYRKALEEKKKTHTAEDKIALVKDLLPPSLKPEGNNPLSLLYDNLSRGLHIEPDDICLEYAESVRMCLLYLVDQVERTKSSQKSFTEGMKKLLDKKSRAKKSRD